MSLTYLAVETDIAVHERESMFWLSRGISSVRVSSMREAIEIVQTKKFLFIGINSSNIDYLPLLRLLRESTNDPIFISSNAYTMQEQGVAIENGADLFGQLSDNPNDNFNSCMAAIKRLDERASQRKKPVAILYHGNILVAPTYHKAFVNDAEIKLTKAEMAILRSLMINKGAILTHNQIFETVYDGEFVESISDNIYSTVKRLRKKINEAGGCDCIETIKDVGYRLRTRNDTIY